MLFEGERVDDIGFGGLKLIQKPSDFCYGVDSVLLAHFAASVGSGSNGSGTSNGSCAQLEAIADLGTGTGVIPLILSCRTVAKKIFGIEVQQDSWQRAVRNAKANSLEDRIEFLNLDVKEVSAKASHLKGKMDMVVSNPPYFEAGGGLTNGFEPKTIARHETTAGLKDFMECASFLLRARGQLCLVHRPSRLADIFCYAREAGLEPKTMKMVRPTALEAPNIVLVHMVKGGGKELRLLPDLAVYNEDGSYTQELLECYQ